MLRIVLPPIALASLSPVHVFIVVPVKVIVVIDVDVTVVPIAIAPVATGPGTQRKSCRAPRQSHAGVVPRIGIRVIGIGRRSSSVNDYRIV
jgi:hypothetical protein